jgi:hypothetical protein
MEAEFIVDFGFLSQDSHPPFLGWGKEV